MGETLTLLLVNNNCADQPAYLCSLISPFVIHYLKNKVTFLVGFNMIKPLAMPLHSIQQFILEAFNLFLVCHCSNKGYMS